MIKFTVYGKPQPQGSMRAFIPKGWNRPVVTSANKNLKPWRQQVSQAALEAAKGEIIPRGVPVSIWLMFYFDPPASLKKSASRLKTTKPDIDKLIRSVLDALTGTIFEDDSQVAVCRTQKCFAQPERLEVFVGTHIAIDVEYLTFEEPKRRVPEEKDLQRPLDFAFA